MAATFDEIKNEISKLLDEKLDAKLETLRKEITADIEKKLQGNINLRIGSTCAICIPCLIRNVTVCGFENSMLCAILLQV